MALKKLFVVGIACCTFAFNTHAVEDIDKQKEALNVIADFADRLCEKIKHEGGSENLELSGTAKAELTGLLKKIADLGIEGGAKYQKAEYEGVLQKDLAELLKNSSKCKLEVWKDLKDKLLVIPAKQTKNFTRNFDFEDHHCSINEERSTNLCVDAGFVFKGMVGEPSYSTKDSCGSRFNSFEQHPSNNQCGVFKIQLVGCGHDSLTFCKGHAWIKGNVVLLGEQIK